MLWFTFLTFLLDAGTIQASTTPPGPDQLTTQETPESTSTSVQCQIPILPGNVILTEYQQTFENGSIARLACAVGYTPAKPAKKTIQCLEGRWTDAVLTCRKKTCGALKDIPHGRYLYTEGIEYGARVTAECDTGYQLYGSNRICNIHGWSGRDLYCEVIKCTELPNIENGAPEDQSNNYEFGQSVTYRCKKDFDMIGDSTITCSEDGTFQPSPPECLKIFCNQLDIPYATRIEGRPPYKHKSFIRYRCHRGYKMTGSDYLVCQKDGWDKPSPNCTVVKCPMAPAVENGEFTTPEKEQYEYGQTVTYRCRKGFRLVGASTVTCSELETFQPSSPQCVVVTCPRPPAIANGQVNGPLLEQYEYGNTVTYSCRKDFKLKGSSTQSCSEDGTFQPSPPECAMTCLRPPAIEFGQFSPLLEEYEKGKSVTYSCRVGFRLLGASTVFCSEDGSFRPDLPTCELHWIAICMIVGSPIILVIVWCLYRRNKKNSGKVAVKSEEDGL